MQRKHWTIQLGATLTPNEYKQYLIKRMLQEQLCNHDVIDNKLSGLNIGEICMNDGELDMDQEQSTIPIRCVSDEQDIHSK